MKRLRTFLLCATAVLALTLQAVNAGPFAISGGGSSGSFGSNGQSWISVDAATARLNDAAGTPLEIGDSYLLIAGAAGAGDMQLVFGGAGNYRLRVRASDGQGELSSGTGGAANYKDLHLANVVVSKLRATESAAPTIASAATIAPTASITFVSGTTTISTITAPSPISAGGGCITLIPTGLWSTNTAGNIALATTGVVNKALTECYDSATTKWYPSY